MPWLQPEWTRKDTQHFPILTMNEKLSMLYIPEALRHLMLNARTSAWINQKRYTTFPYIYYYIPYTQALYWMPGLQPGWTKKDTQHFPILTMNEKLSMFYIPEALRHLMLKARTSAWINQKGYTTFPFIDHEWKAKYVTYPRSAQALYWMPGLQPGWTRKDTQHFPFLTTNIKLSMLHIPEVLRHNTECQDFSLGEPKRIHNISLYWPWMKS